MLQLAFRNLSRRKLRTALTLFGVSIAVMTLASLLALARATSVDCGASWTVWASR